MKRKLSSLISLLIALTLLPAFVPGGAAPTTAQAQPTGLAPDRARVAEALRSSPIMFIENVGQFDTSARFQVWGGPGTMWLADDAIWVTVFEQADKETRRPGDKETGGQGDKETVTLSPPHLVSPSPRKGVNLRLSFSGANPRPRLEPFDRLDTVVSYFIGNDPDRWHPDVPVWGGVRYVDLYPGIDLVVGVGLARDLELPQVSPLPWRLEVRDGADLSAVRLRVEGADELALDGDYLRLTTVVGDFPLPLLQAVAAGGTSLPMVGGGPEVRGNGIISPFASARATPPITKSPDQATAGQQDLLYATFLGGYWDDAGRAIAVDGDGNAYVTGVTWSSSFPTTPGVFDRTYNGGDYYGDAFVVKLNTAGSGLVYATFLGGSEDDAGKAIAVSMGGYAYVTGVTWSSDFPTTPSAFDRTCNGRYDAFVVRLSSWGSGLAYATFLGGSGDDKGNGIAIDGSGNAYVTGATWSSNFPTTPSAFDRSCNGGYDAFVVKLNTAGSGLAYATFLGGSGHDWGGGIAVDGGGAAYVTGSTPSYGFPTTPGAFDRTYNGGDYYGDAFLVKLNTAGSGLAYATFLGGSNDDWGSGIAVDGGGAAYITGNTYSSSFPTTPGVFDRTYNGGSYLIGDAFVAKLDLAGSSLLYATFLGGNESDDGWAIAVDGGGNAYVTGATWSSNFPTTSGAFDRTYNGSCDAFVVSLNAAGSDLAYATFLGGSDIDSGWAITVDGGGAAYLMGETLSSDFPTTPGAFDGTYKGGEYYGDAFVGKLAMGGTLTYSISGRVRDGSGNPIAGVTISDGAGHTATSDNNGNYALSELAAGSYTITPSKSGYTFSPTSRAVSVPPNATGQDFTAMLITYSISGRVTDVNNNPVPGTTISDGAGHATITDSNGNYILDGLAPGTYTLTPSKGAGWTFKPSSHIVSVPPEAMGKNFKAFDRPPIVFVHGWQGSPTNFPCRPPDPDSLFEMTDEYLRTAGNYYVEYAYLESTPCYTPELADNVPHLRDAISLAKQATNQPEVILITHSMGGLVARAYIENKDIYEDDVAALFTFGSPHQGVPIEEIIPWEYFISGVVLGEPPSLGEICTDYGQPVICQLTEDGMASFNRDYPERAGDVIYHAINGDAPDSSRGWLGRWSGERIPGNDDALVPTSSGIGLPDILDPFVTDEVHSPNLGPRTYFIRDGGPSDSYMKCLKPILVNRESATCIGPGTAQAVAEDSPELTAHTPLEYGILLTGQTVTRTLWFEGGPTLLASRWQTGTVAFTLVDPGAQVIDPAYVATHPDVAAYEAEATAAMYYFSNASAGRWRLVLEGEDIPPEGSNYVTSAAFESAVQLGGGTDRNWYAPGAAAAITASLSGSPASTTVTATILYADGTSETVELLPQGGDEYQATHTVPNAPGYTEARLVATGATADQIPFERGTSLVFQISSGSVALSGVYSDAPQPRSAGSSLYQALLVTAGIEAALGGEVGLSADLVDAEGQFVAHALTIEEAAAGNGWLTLRFDGDDIYASQRSGPYTLTNLLLTDHRGVPLVLAEAEDVYTTAAYDYQSFDRVKIYLPLGLCNR